MLSSYTWGEFAPINSSCSSSAGPRRTAIERKIDLVLISRKGVQAEMVFMKAQKSIQDFGIIPHYYERPGMGLDSCIPCIAWSSVPLCCQAVGGGVPPDRVDRKAIQIESMLYVALNAALHLLTRPVSPSPSSSFQQQNKIRIVEFCAGSGFVALPLAWLLREYASCLDIVLVDWKGPSLDIAHTRIEALNRCNDGILNGVVRVVEQDIATYDEHFHLGLSLHACGPATDVSLAKCVDARAFFVHTPCCLGKICKVRSTPLSRALQDALAGKECEKKGVKGGSTAAASTYTSRLFTSLVRAGDFGHGCESSRRGEKDESARRLAKSLVEEDRRQWAEERGFTASGLMKMRQGASPKGDMLYGAPDEAGFEWPQKWVAVV